jgi:hypothetical protein
VLQRWTAELLGLLEKYTVLLTAFFKGLFFELKEDACEDDTA